MHRFVRVAVACCLAVAALFAAPTGATTVGVRLANPGPVCGSCF